MAPMNYFSVPSVARDSGIRRKRRQCSNRSTKIFVMSSNVKFIQGQCPGCKKLRTIHRMVEAGCVFGIAVCDQCFVDRPELRRFDPLWVDTNGKVINFCAVAGMIIDARHAAQVAEIIGAIVDDQNRLVDNNVLLAAALSPTEETQ
jgi:hypothetical protein